MRTAIGAGRWRIVRQLLTESVALSFVGGALGLLVAFWGLDALRSLAPANIPRLQNVALDGRVLLFTSAVTMLTGVLFGLAPALRGSRVNLGETLKEGGAGLDGRRPAAAQRARRRGGRALARAASSARASSSAASCACSRSSRGSTRAASSRCACRSRAPATQGERATEFFDQLLERVRALPGVGSAGAASILPLGGGIGWGGITIEGYVPTTGQELDPVRPAHRRPRLLRDDAGAARCGPVLRRAGHERTRRRWSSSTRTWRAHTGPA